MEVLWLTQWKQKYVLGVGPFFLSSYKFDNARKFQIDSLKVLRGLGESCFWGSAGIQWVSFGLHPPPVEAAFCPYATKLNIFLLWKEFEIHLHSHPLSWKSCIGPICIFMIYQFPEAAVTTDHKLGYLTQQKRMLSQSESLKSRC